MNHAPDPEPREAAAHWVEGDAAKRHGVDAGPIEPVPSDALLRGRSAVHIEHNGTLYLLRATRLGKLILTK